MITHHTQLLQFLIDRYGLKRYLELGVQNPYNNFNKLINLDHRHGVDPDPQTNYINGVTSDLFFEINKSNPKCNYDLIFIDGYHHADQVKRDFENSLRCLTDGGYIILHDTCPDEEQYTIVPRQTRKWFGTVYQFAMILHQYSGINFITLNEDCGITIIWKDESRIYKGVVDHESLLIKTQIYLPEIQEPKYYIAKNDWNAYKTWAHDFLNIIPPTDLEKYLPAVKDEVTI